jgi:hypothetical protein
VCFVPSGGFTRALEVGSNPAQRSPEVRTFGDHVPLSEGPTGQTDHMGRFALDGLPVAPGRINVHHAALASGRSEPLPAEGEQHIDVVLQTGAARNQLHVRVVTESGRPAAGAWVEATAPGGAMFVLRADEQGTLLFPTASPGPFGVRARDVEERLLPSEVEHVPADGEPRSLTLRSGSTLDVTVVDAEGAPVPAFEWTLRWSRSGGAQEARSGRGTDGRLQLGVRPASEPRARGLSLEVRAPNQVAVAKTVRYLPEGPRPLRFQLQPTGPLEGLVLCDGAPVQGAVVRVREERELESLPAAYESVGRYGPEQVTTTDDEGRYRLREVGAGTYTVCVTARGCAPFVYVSFGRGRAECLERIELAPGGTLLGLVVLAWDMDDGGPGGPPELRARARDANGVEMVAPVRPNGSYVLYGLPPGTHEVQLERLRRRPGGQSTDGEWRPEGALVHAAVQDGRLTTVTHAP